jgi:perosamine synthetase
MITEVNRTTGLGQAAVSSAVADGHSPYETAFAAYFDPAAHAFSFWKGRVALYAILLALDLEPGDEVILPGFTCVVVPNAVRLASCKPVYVDIEPDSYHLDPAGVEAAITSRTRAILVQHTFGMPGPLEAVN